MRVGPLPRPATTYLLKRVRSVSRLLLPPAGASPLSVLTLSVHD